MGQATKSDLRQRVWTRLQTEGVAAFPFPPVGRIANFQGAREAAEALATLDVWEEARIVKTNPDSPQKWARQRALLEGKVLYMAVPRLRQAECFLELNPGRLLRPKEAATIKGAFAHGMPRRPERVKPVDLILTGSVAVDRTGGRVGKGGGYADLEYALGREFGFVRAETPVVTTVHPLQILDESVPMERHDVSLDYVATAEAVRPSHERRPQPTGLLWDLLPAEKIAAIPALAERVPGTAREG